MIERLTAALMAASLIWGLRLQSNRRARRRCDVSQRADDRVPASSGSQRSSTESATTEEPHG